MDEAGAVAQFLTEYYRAFSTLDVDAILPYFHEPSLLIGPQGVFDAATRPELAGLFTMTMEGLRARGYGRSELSLQQLQILSATAAHARGVALRYKTDGQELDRAGVTYVLHKSEAGWKIAVVVLHDVERVSPQPQN
jgi:ketosteroid isomerase-like protein